MPRVNRGHSTLVVGRIPEAPGGVPNLFTHTGNDERPDTTQARTGHSSWTVPWTFGSFVFFTTRGEERTLGTLLVRFRGASNLSYRRALWLGTTPYRDRSDITSATQVVFGPTPRRTCCQSHLLRSSDRRRTKRDHSNEESRTGRIPPTQGPRSERETETEVERGM